MNRAPIILTAALLLGLAADALLRQGFAGLAFPVWIALVALAALAIARRVGAIATAEARAWLAVAVAAAAGLAWRDAPELQALDFAATLFALGLAAIVLGVPAAGLGARRLRDTVWAGGRVIRDVFIGALPLVLRELLAPRTRSTMRGRGWPIARAGLIVIALVVVFGSLLRGADPVFASLVRLPDLDIGLTFSHVVVTGFFGWVFAGWARGAFVSPATARRPPEQLPVSLSGLDVSAALGTLVVLFALFVAAQLGLLFGGERFLQARTGLTAAEYARQGFFQMVIVVALVVPLVAGTRALLRPEPGAARRHTLLALTAVVLLLAMIASAAMRMRLYIAYFGLTADRVYTLAIMGWLAVVLVWLAATTLRGRERRFIAGAVISGLAIVAALNIVAPDAVVARVNVARASRLAGASSTILDLEHLTTLSAEGVRPAVAAVLAPPTVATDSAQRVALVTQRCRASEKLLKRWGPASPHAAHQREAGGWRRWNAGEQQALRVVGSASVALREVQHTACSAAQAASAARVPPPTLR